MFYSGRLPLHEGRISIFDLSKLDSRAQRAAADLLLSDVWRSMSTTDSAQPIFLAIDEFQNLGLSVNGPLGRILAEGRKYRINTILATQSLGIHFGPSQEKLLTQTRYKLFFRPGEADARHVVLLIGGPNTTSAVNELRHLKTGEAILCGPAYIGVEAEPVYDPIRLTARLPVSAV